MIILNNLWDEVVVNVRSHEKLEDITSFANYERDSDSVVIAPLQTAIVQVDESSTIYVFSYDTKKRIHRTDYISVYSMSEPVPETMMLAELRKTVYRVNSKDIEKTFAPEIIFALNYIIPDRVVAGFGIYNIVLVLILVIVSLIAIALVSNIPIVKY